MLIEQFQGMITCFSSVRTGISLLEFVYSNRVATQENRAEQYIKRDHREDWS
jgi:hypothetical protein